MKKTFIICAAAVTLVGTSCQKYLNINQNPNSATASNPDYVLPKAIVYTAANEDGFNDYGAQIAGYQANAGGYGGFGDNWTYDWSTSDYNGLWTGNYDVLQDLQYIINTTDTSANMSYYTAVCKIMRAYNFELLVDTYNDVPYSKALQGQSDVSPSYDSAAVVYVSLASLLDTAIALINNAPSTVTPIPSSSDPMFGGNMTNWKQFANTVKLRMIIRASGVVTFANTTFDPAGFLTTDAVVNPGYGRTSGASGSQQNPNWNDWVGSYSGSAGNRAWMANTYVTGFYNGVKLFDTARARAIYYSWNETVLTTPPTYTYGAQLGTTNYSELSAPAYTSAWYCTAYGQSPSSITSIGQLGSNIGVMKGPDMGEVLILAAESYFLQAEADMRGILPGNAQNDYNSGIVASFNYLYELSNGNLASGMNPAGDAAAYQADNATGAYAYLANYPTSGTPAQQLESIITQKYIAMNMITSQEAWNEYRRTGYPVSVNTQTNAYLSFASTLSQATRPDKMSTRILYPASEYSSNANNVPNNISPFTSLIFWAH
jgi:hypothetical protein